MNNKQVRHRLFFALWPSGKIRHSIVEVLSRLPVQMKGRVIQPHNLHETLHFVGQVSGPDRDCMNAAAQTVTCESFQLTLDHVDTFPKAKVLWMGAQKTPDQLTQLHEKLGSAIEGCGYHCEERAYTPHVTLMRKYNGQVPEQIEFSIPWHIEDFVLVESVNCKQGVSYQVIEKYPLT